MDLPSKSRVNLAGDRLRLYLTGGAPPDYHSGPDFTADLRTVDQWRRQHAYPIRLCMPGLRKWAERYGAGAMPVERLKRHVRMVEKLMRHPSMKLARMQDIGGARVVAGTPSEVHAVAAEITEHWTISRTYDRRDTPNTDTGYRALHLVVRKRDRISGHDREVEIQLRTELQHRWAEEVARVDDRWGFALKDGVGPEELRTYFRMASDLLYWRDHELPIAAGFEESFSNVRQQVVPYFQTRP